jgi:hypothetical protein
MSSKKDHDESRAAAARQRAEIATHERLHEIRGELGELCNMLDRVMLARPRMHAGGGRLPSLDNLLRFPRMR